MHFDFAGGKRGDFPDMTDNGGNAEHTVEVVLHCRGGSGPLWDP